MRQVVNWFRKTTDKLVLPVVRLLARLGVHPNVVTVCALVCGLLAVGLFADRVWFVVFGVAHLILDKLDGALARFARQKTKQGSLLDHVCDRLVELALLVRLSVFASFGPFVAGLFVVYNVVYWLRMKELFFARTLLFLLAFLQYYEVALAVAGVVYLVGLAVQLKEILLKPRKV